MSDEVFKEDKIKDFVMSYLSERKMLQIEENIVFAEKAFKVNSVLRWCIDKKNKGLLSSTLANKHFKMIDLFLNNEVDLIWVRGNVKISKKNE